MPIHCPIDIAPSSTEEFSKLDYGVMKYAFATQNELGRLADERVYQADLSRRLFSNGLRSHVEVSLSLAHKTFHKTLSLDLVVDQRSVYELKTVTELNASHEAQLLSYLYLLDLPRGKLVNFRPASVESLFVNAPIPREERCGFSVVDDDCPGDLCFKRLVIELVRDWGTSLSVSLYRQALVHLLGGPEAVERMLPMTYDQSQLANQRFYLSDVDTAFEVTAFVSLNSSNEYGCHLQRLLAASPLKRIHWINIGLHCVAIKTFVR